MEISPVVIAVRVYGKDLDNFMSRSIYIFFIFGVLMFEYALCLFPTTYLVGTYNITRVP